MAKIQSTNVLRAKLQPRWTEGIWLGRALDSDEHIIGTKDGIMMTRSVKRLDDHQRWQQSVLLSVKGVPWDITGNMGRRQIAYKIVPPPPVVDNRHAVVTLSFLGKQRQNRTLQSM